MIQQHIIVTGKVHGVYFRVSATEQAQSLGLTGWVRNNQKGQVEIMVCGKATLLEKFIEWCQDGPPAANVDQVRCQPCAIEHFEDFRITY